MYLQNITVRFLRYNQWANERLTSWLMSIDRTILYANTGSSFGTIDRTLQHMLAAQIYWHDILVNGTINAFDRPLKEHAVADVVNELMLTSERLVRDLATLSEDQLIGRIKVSDSHQSLYEYILHVVNHGSYHRGQVITMCRALGVSGEIPVTDYDAYLWWIENV